ncbi:hypothetical protein TSOC_012366 [Tetrabaena socialis]|uniref:Uncharacterized protein n=1 Tax=Tetrabaena socialis TaxID=47790 RepID=A0A2J7ZN70_9CHLO|nr:hypothetical protein TSOC_012366 [Tetrabaena socialis]|eukprot:PNH01723.1 hypothetical protein TSOC_012366 [Tetrabaena socialis]
MPTYSLDADVLVALAADTVEGIVHNGADVNAPILAGYDIFGCFKLLSHHGTWLQVKGKSAPPDKQIHVSKDAAEDRSDVWIFYKFRTGDNEYALCNYSTHRFVTADLWQWVTCNRAFPYAWEHFQVHHQGEHVALLCRASPLGPRWLTVEPNGNVRSNQRMADAWEKWTLVPFKHE